MALNFGLLDTSAPGRIAGGFQQGFQQAQDRNNMLAQQERQNKLADMQMAAATRAEEEAAGIRNAYNTAPTLAEVPNALRKAGQGQKAFEVEGQLAAQQAAAQKEKIARAKETLGLMKTTATSIMANPAMARASLAKFGELTGSDISAEMAQLDQLGDNPDAIKQWAAGHALEADKLLPRFETIQLGGSVERQSIDPITGKTSGTQSLKKTMTPGEIAADTRARQTLALQKQRFDFDKSQGGEGQKAPSGYRWNADKTALEAIPGGPAAETKSAGAATEGERKAATLLKRLEGSEAQLSKALGESPGAAKPGLLATGMRAAGQEILANAATPQARQRVEAAQLDILDAALTLGTGAAYTKEQLEGYRKSYFPQIGDDKKTIDDKQVRLKNVIEAAKIAAGRAGPKDSKPSGATGDWGGSSPNVSNW